MYAGTNRGRRIFLFNLAVARYDEAFCTTLPKKYPAQSVSLIFLQFLIIQSHAEEICC